MTIRRGDPWGEPARVPIEVRIVDGDRSAHHWVTTHRRAGLPIAPVGVRAGDLARTCGGGGAGRFDGPVLYAPVDVLRVTADPGTPAERVTWSVAHVVARRSWWRGEVVLVMNAQFLGAYDVAPRAHPNDGLAEALRVDPAASWRTRLAARRRARTGTHLPHPQLTVQRAPSMRWRLARPLVIWVDGERWGTAGELRVDVEPDALHVYV